MSPKSRKQSQPKWIWYGYEIHGNHQIDSDKIAKVLSVRAGRTVNKNSINHLEIAQGKIETKFHPAFVECSLLRFIDPKDHSRQAYAIVDIVEKGDESRIAYRKIEERDLELTNSEILECYSKLRTRLQELFDGGTPVLETYEQGYKDYSDAECHQLAQKLAEFVPPFLSNILEVLEFHQDGLTRAIAADLLCWSKGDAVSIIAKIHALLDDPSIGVRNNISRYMIPYIRQVYGAYVKHPLVLSLLRQLNRPSHPDRNKAIYCLLDLAKASGFLDRDYIKRHGQKLIQKIADTSILPNVSEPAVQLLALLER